jgi:hypothetical protein
MEDCENAEQLVEALFVAKADQMETMIDEDESASAPSATTTTTDANGTTTEGYRPAPVASLIHNPHVGVMAGTLLEEQIGVPNGIVGFIIGRGGESIASMQARTGCKVQIQKENEMQPGKTAFLWGIHFIYYIYTSALTYIVGLLPIYTGSFQVRHNESSLFKLPQRRQLINVAP